MKRPDEKHEQQAMVQVLIQRFTERRLPRALELKERVDRGECLDNFDIEFLEKVFRDSEDAASEVHLTKELEPLVAKATELYHHITERGLENEKAKNSEKR